MYVLRENEVGDVRVHVLFRLAACAVVLGSLSLPAHSAFAATGTGPSPPQPHYRVAPLLNPDLQSIAAQSATGGTIPLWSGAATSGGVTYPYQMVGKNPFVHTPDPTVLVGTEVIPVIIHFPDGTTSDPTRPTGCGTSTALSPIQLAAGSPIFVHHTEKVGGTFVGKGQYVSNFQRANFWNAIHSSGNPDYRVALRPTDSTPMVDISAGQIAPFNPITDPFGPLPCGHLWAIDALALDSYVQKTLIPSLHISPTHFPIFLSSNVVGYVGTLLTTVLGNHGAFLNAQGRLQTYAEVEYDTSGIFSGVSDVSVLAHEVGEWVDDPLGTNPTPASYLDIGCSHTLEVGDQLVGTDVTVGPMPDGITYHPQELAFFSWFYNQVPSQSVNPAWYSSNGTLTTDSAVTPLC
jgi:hypothetical protein